MSKPIPYFNRRAVEYAINDHLHGGGMRFNDSKERVILPGGTLQRLLDVIDAPAQDDTPPAAQPVAVPVGWALVPVEPTKEMMRASRWSGSGDVSINEPWARLEAWGRMIKAAPTPPAASAKPLTDEQIDKIGQGEFAVYGENCSAEVFARAFARAIERAHGIGGQQ